MTPHGQIGFVGNDVAKVLGYSNYRNAITNHVDADDKLRTQIEYAGQKRDVTFINESGLYALILSNKRPKVPSVQAMFNKRYPSSDSPNVQRFCVNLGAKYWPPAKWL